MAAVTLTVKM